MDVVDNDNPNHSVENLLKQLHGAEVEAVEPHRNLDDGVAE